MIYQKIETCSDGSKIVYKFKPCSRCKIDKPIEVFQKRSRSKDGLSSYCDSCTKELYRSKYSKSRIKNTYGIEYSHVESLIKSQSNRCAICSNIFKELSEMHIDHCHKSGNVRGLLCHNCNSGIGMLKDSADIIFSAYEYLIKWDSKNE